MIWPTVEDVLATHRLMLAASGGAPGVRDLGLLDSALNRPLATYAGVELYADAASKAAALIESLIGNHPFVDGNKRTAMATAISMLGMNGFRLAAGDAEIEETAVLVARRRLALGDLAWWVRKRLQPW